MTLPTPVVNDMGAGKTPAEWDAWTADMQARHGNGNGHGASLSIEAARLLTERERERERADLATNTDRWRQQSLRTQHQLEETGRTPDSPPLNPDEHGEPGCLKLLPTPTTQDAANLAGPSQWNRNTPPLNVEAARIGGHTAQPSPGGKP